MKPKSKWLRLMELDFLGRPIYMVWLTNVDV